MGTSRQAASQLASFRFAVRIFHLESANLSKYVICPVKHDTKKFEACFGRVHVTA